MGHGCRILAFFRRQQEEQSPMRSTPTMPPVTAAQPPKKTAQPEKKQNSSAAKPEAVDDSELKQENIKSPSDRPGNAPKTELPVEKVVLSRDQNGQYCLKITKLDGTRSGVTSFQDQCSYTVQQRQKSCILFSKTVNVQRTQPELRFGLDLSAIPKGMRWKQGGRYQQITLGELKEPGLQEITIPLYTSSLCHRLTVTFDGWKGEIDLSKASDALKRGESRELYKRELRPDTAPREKVTLPAKPMRELIKEEQETVKEKPKPVVAEEKRSDRPADEPAKAPAEQGKDRSAPLGEKKVELKTPTKAETKSTPMPPTPPVSPEMPPSPRKTDQAPKATETKAEDPLAVYHEQLKIHAEQIADSYSQLREKFIRKGFISSGGEFADKELSKELDQLFASGGIRLKVEKTQDRERLIAEVDVLKVGENGYTIISETLKVDLTTVLDTPDNRELLITLTTQIKQYKAIVDSDEYKKLTELKGVPLLIFPEGRELKPDSVIVASRDDRIRGNHIVVAKVSPFDPEKTTSWAGEAWYVKGIEEACKRSSEDKFGLPTGSSNPFIVTCYGDCTFTETNTENPDQSRTWKIFLPPTILRPNMNVYYPNEIPKIQSTHPEDIGKPAYLGETMIDGKRRAAHLIVSEHRIQPPEETQEVHLDSMGRLVIPGSEHTNGNCVVIDPVKRLPQLFSEDATPDVTRN